MILKHEIETQIEGVRVLNGEEDLLAACYHWVSPRMRIDHQLDEQGLEKNKLRQKLETVSKYVCELFSFSSLLAH